MRRSLVIYLLGIWLPWVFVILGNAGYNLVQMAVGAPVEWHLWPALVWQVTGVWAGVFLPALILVGRVCPQCVTKVPQA